MVTKSDSERVKKNGRIEALIQTILEAEHELQTLIDDQYDGVENDSHPLLSNAQERLQQSEAIRHEIAVSQMAILNALPAHIALIDSKGVIVSVNEAWQHFASANALNSAGFCVGDNYISICEDAQGECADEAWKVARGIRNVLSGGREVFAIEYPCHSPNEKRWFRLMVTPLIAGRQSAAVVMHVNVTARREAEEALKERELQQRLLAQKYADETRRLRESQAVANIGSWETDLVTLDVTWSAETYRIFEVDSSDFENQHLDFLQYVHPDERKAVDKAFLDSFDLEGPFSLEHRICVGANRVKHIEERWIIHKDRAGKPVRAFGTCQDVTNRVQAQKSLSDSESRFRSFFDQAAVGMVIASEDGRFLQANQQFANIIGYTKEELVDIPCAQVTHADDRNFEAIAIAEMIAGTRTGVSWEKRYLRKDGSIVWCVQSLAPLRLEGGDNQFIAVIDDISEKKQAEAAVRQSQAMIRIAGAAAKIGGWFIDRKSVV